MMKKKLKDAKLWSNVAPILDQKKNLSTKQKMTNREINFLNIDL